MLLPTCVAAQDIRDVKQQQQAAREVIASTSQKIKQNTKQTEKQLNRLNYITAEIKDLESGISKLDRQLKSIIGKIGMLNDSVRIYDNELARLKANYANAIKKMQGKNSTTDHLVFLFSAETFEQTVRRYRYLKEFSAWRKLQFQKILTKQEQLKIEKLKLEKLKISKQNTLEKLAVKKSTLESKKEKQGELIAGLREEGESLNILLQEKERLSKKLNDELERLIAEEERKAEERRIAEEKRKAEELRKAEEAKKEAAKKKDKGGKKKKETKKEEPKKQPEVKPEKTPEKEIEKEEPVKGTIIKVSGTFKENKGKLIAPVASSYKVVKPFGRNQHPELRHVITENNGIDIETASGSNARCVFDGKVSAVFQTEGFNTVIMIRHGSYITVYVNLANTFVASGDAVKAGQEIGRIFSDPEDDKRTILHFEVRKEKEKLNPELWIK